MVAIDIALGIILAYGAWQGWNKGFFCRMAGWLGLVVGSWAAIRYFQPTACFLSVYTGWSVTANRVVAFVTLWMAVSVAIRLLAQMLTVAAEAIGVNGLNRMTGALLGLFVYALGLSCLIHLAEWGGVEQQQMGDRSVLYTPLRGLVSYTYDGCKELLQDTVWNKKTVEAEDMQEGR